ncbi:hypothetical protein PIROE2DRAFT_67914 [Piromyces sp. E2]|nr:hypothetical protein PIROE2DRAFT_67914 [Piromyces sp. E2]|eukprot:OUM56260.1 hypothetical protein PIROE2DRAFT_67914 [Piromyces sp. E2]
MDPATVTGEYVVKTDFNSILPGSSMSAPMVTGLIATLLSEFPEKNLTTASMRQYLIEHAEEGIIYDLPVNEKYPNLFVNNGKKIIYNASLTTNAPSDGEEVIDSEIEVEVDNSDSEVEEIDSGEEEQ